MRHVFIVNPAAGKVNQTFQIREKLKAIKTDAEIEVAVTEGVGDAVRIAREHAQRGDEVRIYSCGGDGTANEVLNGIAGYDNCALGVVPTGSGNDFVRTMSGYEKEDFLDLDRMIRGKDKKIDLIECGGRYSMNILSVGFDCAVANNVEKFKKLPLVSAGLAYKLSIVYCLFSRRKHRLRIWVDDEKFEKADYNKTTLLAIGGNGSYYGGGIKAAPLAKTDDGLLDFVHVKTVSVLRFVTLLKKYIKGEHINNPKYPFVAFKRCKKIRIEAEEPVDVNCDGEIFVLKDPEIRVLPGALRIIEPATD